MNVVYNPEVISLDSIVTTALEAHDPTQGTAKETMWARSTVPPFTRSGTLRVTTPRSIQQRINDYAPRTRRAMASARITTEVMPLADTPGG